MPKDIVDETTTNLTDPDTSTSTTNDGPTTLGTTTSTVTTEPTSGSGSTIDPTTDTSTGGSDSTTTTTTSTSGDLPCNHDGVCDPDEDVAGCLADCAGCEPDETSPARATARRPSAITTGSSIR